jgi:hypothetical protein
MSSQTLSPNWLVTHESCRDAICRFFYYLDEWRYEDMMRLMSVDAVWVRQGETLCGEAAIRAALEKRNPKLRIRHVITNSIVDQKNDGTAFAIFYLTSYKHDDARHLDGPAKISGPFRFLTIESNFVQIDNRWHIQKLVNVDQFHFHSP